MSGFEVIKAGVFTLLQDKGRFSYTHVGVTTSGALDEYSFLMANTLLKNNLDTNILEIAFSNVVLKSIGKTKIAITGASCEFYINDILKPTWQTHNIEAGDVLKVGKILEGQRVYLGVLGGFDIPKEFGSNSTTIKEQLGGLEGTKLRNGDFLAWTEQFSYLNQRLKKEYQPIFNQTILTLRVVLSCQEDSFTKEEKNKFFNSVYTITSDFNRMACKLSGEKIISSKDGIISEGISFGSIQIPKDGQPIILLKERQTIGGYPKIGSVLGIDCFKLAQMKIGCKIKFENIEIEKAQEKTRNFYNIFS
jgi:biotin-dependent carboxylase-like uncharacterized protein